MYTVADPRLPRDDGDGGESDGGTARSSQLAPTGPTSTVLTSTGPTSTSGYRQVVTHVDVVSVAKVATVFFSALAMVGLLAAATLWIGAATAGLVGNAEGFMSELGFQGFSFDALQLLRGAIFAGLILVVSGAGMAVLAAILYNVVSDVVGGVELGARARRNSGH